jgi:hypothetical protein
VNGADEPCDIIEILRPHLVSCTAEFGSTDQAPPPRHQPSNSHDATRRRDVTPV